jgi:hypothetical protein
MIAHDTLIHRIREQLAAEGPATGGRGAPAGPSEPSAAHARPWAAEPVHSDAKIRENTGHTWDEWIDLIDAGPGRTAGHTAIAAWVQAVHGVPGWWAQGVTVGYERITGLRLPGQMPDGTFSVSRSRVLGLSADRLRAILLDDSGRADLFPGLDTVLRSKPTSKALRFAAASSGAPLGSLLFSADPQPEGRLRLTVTHDKLTGSDEAERWKQFWADWLAAVERAAVVMPRDADQTSSRASVATADSKSSGRARE